MDYDFMISKILEELEGENSLEFYAMFKEKLDKIEFLIQAEQQESDNGR